MHNERLLREAIRLSLNELKVGDVKKALKIAAKKKSIEKAKAAAKSAGMSGAMAAIELFPGVASMKSAIEGGMALVDLYNAAKDVDPKEKKKNELWDLVTIDPETSKIIDDAVEDNFIKDLSQNVAGRGDEEEMPDADAMLSAWMKNKFSGAHIKK